MVYIVAFVAEVACYFVGSPLVSLSQFDDLLFHGICKLGSTWASTLFLLKAGPTLSLVAIPPEIEDFAANPSLGTNRIYRRTV